ncbi:MAG: H/ACA RNA-protein complex component Gar1 [Halobacteria archaeon]|nr:H/ACA RNA-protein complex component Gar1 [Halobacteria archaeon]
MKRLGRVVSSHGGVLVVRCDDDVGPDDVGTESYDKSLDSLGEVVDVFGPVDEPYALVEHDGSFEEGTKVYVRD